MRASSVCLQGSCRLELHWLIGAAWFTGRPQAWTPLRVVQLQPSTSSRDGCGNDSWGGKLMCLRCRIVPGGRLVSFEHMSG